MIDYEKKVPEYYLQNSRDFQLLVRLLTVGLSGAKHDSATLLHINNPEIINTISLPLLLTKVGIINSKYNYTDTQMIHICKCFKDIVRKKGTLESIKKLCKLYSICNNVSVNVIVNDSSSIYITYSGSVDEKLLESLIYYVLPVGCIFAIQNVEIEENDEKLVLDNNVLRYSKFYQDRFKIYSNRYPTDIIHKINTTEIYKTIEGIKVNDWKSINEKLKWEDTKELTWFDLLQGDI